MIADVSTGKKGYDIFMILRIYSSEYILKI